VILFGYATIFFLFLVGGITKNAPPLFSDYDVAAAELADPLPQALTLTAIVISIGVQLFVIVLLKKVYGGLRTEDLDDLNATDSID
jgi:multicomponent Na+:H+ antiporter subunit C